MSSRIPAHLEVSGLIRVVGAAGGFAAVLQRGESESGAILILTMDRGENARLFERLPRLDGSRAFVETKSQDAENKEEFADYLARRRRQDPDSWLIELDIAEAERFVAQIGTLS